MILIDDPWISVEDKLPDLLKKVLFHWIGPEGNKNISMGYLCKQGWDIYLPYHSFQMHPKRLKVTHWRELYEFPKISEEEINDFLSKNKTLFET